MVFWREAFRQPFHLLLPLTYELVQVALANQEGRFHADKVLVVSELRPAQVAAQDVQNHTLSAVQVLL